MPSTKSFLLKPPASEIRRLGIRRPAPDTKGLGPATGYMIDSVAVLLYEVVADESGRERSATPYSHPKTRRAPAARPGLFCAYEPGPYQIDTPLLPAGGFSRPG
jgi:hypothetical protein